MVSKGLFEGCRFQGIAHSGLQVYDVCACTLRNFNDLAAEKAKAPGDDRIALFKQIRQYCLCTGKAGPGDTQVHLVFRLEYPAQHIGSFFENSEKLRVKVTKLRCRSHAQN